jgi:hypothetical protein
VKLSSQRIRAVYEEREKELIKRYGAKAERFPCLTEGTSDRINCSNVLLCYPRLKDRPITLIAAPRTTNCHAHTFEQEHWFGPDFLSHEKCCWDTEIFPSQHITCWREALKRIGWREGSLQPFSEKLQQACLYADSRGYVTHSARMIGPDNWESKQGVGPILRGHRLNDICDILFKAPRYFFRFPIP